MLPKGNGAQPSSGVLARDLRLTFSSQTAMHSGITSIPRICRNKSGSVNMLHFGDVSI
jgi:hypothetical protein